MNLSVKEIDVIIAALMDYLSKFLDTEDEWHEIAITILSLIKSFKKLRKEKDHE